MSIVINGMNMPKGNGTKNVLIYSDGTVFTGHKDDANYSAEERKRGKWQKIHRKCYRCLVCERVSEFDTPFCPMCGADMRGGQDV